jgi:colanic acid/amylovoran biosynthesis glycosyltransferase
MTSVRSRDLLFITSRYPHGHGETFINEEVAHLRRNWDRVIFAPTTVLGELRCVPGVWIDYGLSASIHRLRKNPLLLAGLALRCGLVWRELCQVANGRRSGGLREWAGRSLLLLATARWLRRRSAPSLVYCYWLDARPAAAAMAMRPRNGIGIPVISRAHGWDVYGVDLSGRPGCYQQLALRSVARCLVVSQRGRDHLASILRSGSRVPRVARLGVSAARRSRATPAPVEGQALRLVSCSNLYPVKRVDRIVQIVAALAGQWPGGVQWDHYGDGYWRPDIEAMVRGDARVCSDVCRFHGQLQHSEVLAGLDNGGYHIFINQSSSEGVPVSMMEAFARGVPAVAPAVGGIGELLDSGCGILHGPGEDPETVAECLLASLRQGDWMAWSSRAKAVWFQDYNADRQFADFAAEWARKSYGTAGRPVPPC